MTWFLLLFLLAPQDSVKAEGQCPLCGSEESFLAGVDQHFVSCYGDGYWERGYYPPNTLRAVNICGKCGTVWMAVPNRHSLRSTADTVHSWWFQKQTQEHVLSQLVELWEEYRDSCRADSVNLGWNFKYRNPYEWTFIREVPTKVYTDIGVFQGEPEEWYYPTPQISGFMSFLSRRRSKPPEWIRFNGTKDSTRNMIQYIGNPPDSINKAREK